LTISCLLVALKSAGASMVVLWTDTIMAKIILSPFGFLKRETPLSEDVPPTGEPRPSNKEPFFDRGGVFACIILVVSLMLVPVLLTLRESPKEILANIHVGTTLEAPKIDAWDYSRLPTGTIYGSFDAYIVKTNPQCFEKAGETINYSVLDKVYDPTVAASFYAIKVLKVPTDRKGRYLVAAEHEAGCGTVLMSMTRQNMAIMVDGIAFLNSVVADLRGDDEKDVLSGNGPTPHPLSAQNQAHGSE
jgi:hypothetical protein